MPPGTTRGERPSGPRLRQRASSSTSATPSSSWSSASTSSSASPKYDEGQLTQLRAALVNTSTLARLAERLQLGESLFVGKGAAKTGARQLPSLLANVFEAMIGAIFLDQGYPRRHPGVPAEHRRPRRVERRQLQGQAAGGGPGPHRDDAELPRRWPPAGPATSASTAPTRWSPARWWAPGGGPPSRRPSRPRARNALQTLTRQPKRRVAARTPATRAAGAARQAALGSPGDSARVRRRVAEVAADRSVSRGPRERPSRPPEPVSTADIQAATVPAPRRRGLLSALRSAAEALVGRVALPEPRPLPAGNATPRRRRRPALTAWPAPRADVRRAAGATLPPRQRPAAATRVRPARRRRVPALPRTPRRRHPATRPAQPSAGAALRANAAPTAGAAGAASAPSTPGLPAAARSGGRSGRAPAEPPAPATATDAEGRRPTRRGRRGGRGRRRPGAGGGAAEAGQP